METKVCGKCRKAKDVSCFKNDKKTKDGKKCYCIDCCRELNAIYIKRKRELVKENPLKIYSSRELIEELKSRGYKGELKVTKKITV